MSPLSPEAKVKSGEKDPEQMWAKILQILVGGRPRKREEGELRGGESRGGQGVGKLGKGGGME